MYVLTFGEEIFKIAARWRLTVFLAGAVQLNIHKRRKAMKPAPVLADDADRVAELRSLNILDTIV